METPRFSDGMFRRGVRDQTVSPFRTMLPEDGVSSPAMERSVVVLPQPEGPRSVTSSPGAIEKLMPATAVTSP